MFNTICTYILRTLLIRKKKYGYDIIYSKSKQIINMYRVKYMGLSVSRHLSTITVFCSLYRLFFFFFFNFF